MRAVIDDLAFLLSADFFGVIFLFIYLFFACVPSEQRSGRSNVPTSAQNICEGSTLNLQRWGQTPACVRARWRRFKCKYLAGEGGWRPASTAPCCIASASASLRLLKKIRWREAKGEFWSLPESSQTSASICLLLCACVWVCVCMCVSPFAN